MFIEEVVDWDNLNEWLWLLNEAYAAQDVDYKNAAISKVIEKLERCGAVRVYPYGENGAKK